MLITHQPQCCNAVQQQKNAQTFEIVIWFFMLVRYFSCSPTKCNNCALIRETKNYDCKISHVCTGVSLICFCLFGRFVNSRMKIDKTSIELCVFNVKKRHRKEPMQRLNILYRDCLLKHRYLLLIGCSVRCTCTLIAHFVCVGFVLRSYFSLCEARARTRCKSKSNERMYLIGHWL